MQKTKKFKLAALLTLMMTTAMASTPTPHTWHTVNSNNGSWNAQLQMINEEGSFVTADGAPITEFTINPKQPVEYGFVLGEGDDFNVAYTLTLTEQNAQNSAQFASKTCVFVITAASPGHPDIRISTYNGAECTFADTGRGENFFVA